MIKFSQRFLQAAKQKKQTKPKQKPKFDLEVLSAPWQDVSLFDIAANLSDDRFFGKYYGKQQHVADFEKVIERANLFGVKKFLFAAGYIEDAQTSIELASKSENFYATIGVHPCRALEPYKEAKLDALTAEQQKDKLDAYFQEIEKMIVSGAPGKIVMIGECGLDYDRFEFAPKEA